MRQSLSLCALVLLVVICTGANHRTANFVVEAPSAELAREVAGAAEAWRSRLAIEWLGKELPRWAHPCHISVRVGDELAPGGRTRLFAEGGRAQVWNISLEGPLARILDSVLPHEMTHAVFATHFRRPLPRWADEGASTVVEHESQRAEQERRLPGFLLSGTALSLAELFIAGDGPETAAATYLQGYSLTQFLLAQGDKHKFVEFLDEGLAGASWSAAVRNHYGFESLDELQRLWLQWALPGR
jgi:hypothetical protein